MNTSHRWGRSVGAGLVLWAVTAPALAQNPGVRSDEENLVALEEAWNDAFYRKDVETIASILSDDFIATYDDGRLGDKETELALVAEFDQQVESSVQDQFIVRVFGDTAVVSFRLNLVGVREGVRAEVQFRFTDVFVLEDGRWQCVSSQSTRVSTE